MTKSIQIKKIIDPGELDLDAAKTSRDIINASLPILDSANAADICGTVLFQGTDGKFYTGTVEFVISEANPEYVANTLENQAEG
jgi:hypothetical protein